MKSLLQRRTMILFVFLALCAIAAYAIYQYRVSSMQKFRADSVLESGGYAIVPLPEASGRIIPGDKAPTQVFELIRPAGTAVSIGRMITSCPCIELESPKTTFAAGERVILTLRNVKETSGQMYSLYVQLTAPVRTTLRHDTYVQSDHFLAHEQPEASGAEKQGDGSAGDGEGSVRQRASLTSLFDQLTPDSE